MPPTPPSIVMPERADIAVMGGGGVVPLMVEADPLTFEDEPLRMLGSERAVPGAGGLNGASWAATLARAASRFRL